MKIIIIGCPGSGKSELTRRINEFLCYPVMHLDKIYHTGGKEHISREELIRKVNEFAYSHENWIIDGNYISTLEMRVQLADTIILLNIPSEICLRNARNREEEYIKTGRNSEDMAKDFNGRMTDEFANYIINFEKDAMPKIQEVLKGYNHKNINIIGNYFELEESIEYIKNIKMVKDMFPKVFFSGYIKNKIKTDKYKEIYYDLVDIKDLAAGPFYHVYGYGNCDYVFTGNHECFKYMKTIEDFSIWCKKIINSYIEVINSEVPKSSEEETDREVLLKQARKMEQLFSSVIDIQKNRLDKGIN